ncbi:MAG TPA: SusD/RagB family nutrient-binding outer membrane lipoprotein [Cyclobacteriaceae bacterium]|nr:SusD/RagB family nutrient-binding outer membrane lipoprotein [Cyclobacteriaceae bacterium]
MKKIYSCLTIVAMLVVATGCKDFLDINDSPNNPLEVSPAVLLSNGLGGTAFTDANELNKFASTVMSYLTGTAGQPAQYDIYNTTGADFGNQWNFELYDGALISYRHLIDRAVETNSPYYAGIGKIMMAYTFSLATDIWGDVPYSHALRGLDDTQPRVDKQEDIYKGNSSLGIQSLFDLTREGLADLNATSSALVPGADDLSYGGTIANWKRAGNTLLLKLAMTISKVDPTLATTVINEVIAGNNYIVDNAQNLRVAFGSAVGSQNPIHQYVNVTSFRDEMIVSTRYLNLLQGLNDPRLTLLVTSPGSKYTTLDNGYRGTLPTPSTTWSRWNTSITGVGGAGPVRLLTNAQRAFIMAEAATILPGVTLPAGKTANDYYQEGIKAHMAEVGVTAAAVTTYFADAANASRVTLSGTAANRQQQIITQKYISWTGNGLEAWNDWRRTGYPTLLPHQNAVGVDGTRPVRAVYTNNEISRNPNFQTGIFQNVRVWWDVD